MTLDVEITVEKIDNCLSDYCWGLYRSDRKDPVIGGLTEKQANNHKKIMLNLINSTKPILNNILVPSSIG